MTGFTLRLLLFDFPRRGKRRTGQAARAKIKEKPYFIF
jgi:hypothetical protein